MSTTVFVSKSSFKLHYNRISMNRFKFLKGLSWGLCISAFMWVGIFKAVDAVFTDQNVVKIQAQKDLEDCAIVENKQFIHEMN